MNALFKKADTNQKRFEAAQTSIAYYRSCISDVVWDALVSGESLDPKKEELLNLLYQLGMAHGVSTVLAADPEVCNIRTWAHDDTDVEAK